MGEDLINLRFKGVYSGKVNEKRLSSSLANVGITLVDRLDFFNVTYDEPIACARNGRYNDYTLFMRVEQVALVDLAEEMKKGYFFMDRHDTKTHKVIFESVTLISGIETMLGLLSTDGIGALYKGLKLKRNRFLDLFALNFDGEKIGAEITRYGEGRNVLAQEYISMWNDSNPIEHDKLLAFYLSDLRLIANSNAPRLGYDGMFLTRGDVDFQLTGWAHNYISALRTIGVEDKGVTAEDISARILPYANQEMDLGSDWRYRCETGEKNMVLAHSLNHIQTALILLSTLGVLEFRSDGRFYAPKIADDY
jgi:hypothetical protein